jgi:hypothetical protein
MGIDAGLRGHVEQHGLLALGLGLLTRNVQGIKAAARGIGAKARCPCRIDKIREIYPPC